MTRSSGTLTAQSALRTTAPISAFRLTSQLHQTSTANLSHAPPSFSSKRSVRASAVAVVCGFHQALLRVGRRSCKLARKAVPDETAEGSRVLAVVGRDGAGKSKVCAALLDLDRVGEKGFADKGRCLEPDKGESTRNFSCYNHIYSQRLIGPHLHLIDTPGHVDRLPLVDQALHAAHGAVMVCSIRGGVDAACGRVLAALEHSTKPFVIFLNGIDREDGAPGFDAALDALEARLGARPVVLFAPAHVGGAETGSTLLNVLSSNLCTSRGCDLYPVKEAQKGKKKGASTSPLPLQFTKWAAQLKEQLVETLASVDDELMEVYLEQDGNVPRSIIDAALIRATAAGKITPLVAGSAKTGLGIDALQEVVNTFIPGGGGRTIAEQFGIDPARCENIQAGDPCLGWAFGKRQSAEGQLLEVRILGGTLRPNESLDLVGIADGSVQHLIPERLLLHGLKGEVKTAKEAGPGDIALVPAPKSLGVLRPALHTDSAADTWMRRGRCTFALQLEKMKPVERDRLLEALEVCLQENDGLRLEDNTETGEHLLSCMGMLHLELLRERLSKEFKISKLPLDQPHVAYHVRLNAPSKYDGTPKKSQSGWASLELVPAKEGSGCQVQDDISKLDPSRGGKVTPEAAVLLEEAILSAVKSAGPGGTPIVDVTVKLLDASASSEEETMTCIRTAIQQAVSSADFTILEPIVELEVDAPIACIGTILEDIRNRRGEVVDTRGSQGDNQVVIASVPLVEIEDYSSVLAELTQGEGFFTFRLDAYEEVTSLAQKRLVAKLAESVAKES